MSTHHLAPVHWQMGQTLLPEHLLAQENAITGEARLRHMSNGVPSYGISKMCWDDKLLESGTLSINDIRLFTKHQNILVDCPGNAKIVSSSIDFDKGTKPDVFYTIVQDNNQPPEPTNSVHQTELKRRLFKIVFSLSKTLSDDTYCLSDNEKVIEKGKLATFSQDKHDCWRLSERYIPPLTQVGFSPFLRLPLRQLNGSLSRYLREIHELYQQQQLPEIRRFEIKHCVNNLTQSLQYLANHLGTQKVAGEINFHPYFLYEQLQSLYRNMSLLGSQWSIPLIHNYQHDDLHTTFKIIFTNIYAHLKLRNHNNRSFKLQLKNGCYQAALPTGLSKSDNLYLVVNSETLGTVSECKYPCISSYQRMPTLFQYALNGVQLRPTTHQSLTHYFGDQAQVFELLKGEEFNHIINERSIAFLAQPEFENVAFYLLHQPKVTASMGATHAPSQ